MKQKMVWIEALRESMTLPGRKKAVHITAVRAQIKKHEIKTQLLQLEPGPFKAYITQKDADFLTNQFRLMHLRRFKDQGEK